MITLHRLIGVSVWLILICKMNDKGKYPQSLSSSHVILVKLLHIKEQQRQQLQIHLQALLLLLELQITIT